MAALINSFNSSLPNITQPAKLSNGVAIIYFILAITSAIGFIINIIAVMMILMQDKVKAVSDILLLHLLFCDLLATSVLTINTVVVLVNDSIGLPYQVMVTMCKILASMAPMAYILGVATLTFMSIERYRAVIHPMKPRISGKKVSIILLSNWLLNIAIAVVAISESRVDPSDKSHCIFYGSDGERSFILIIAVSCIVLIAYIIPIIIMLYCYTKIIVKLKLLTTITQGHVTKESQSQIQKKRIIKTLIAASVIFTIVGIPVVAGLIVTINVASKTSNLTNLERDTGNILIAVEVLSLIIASTYNPAIYFVRKIENCKLSCYHKVQATPRRHQTTVTPMISMLTLYKEST